MATLTQQRNWFNENILLVVSVVFMMIFVTWFVVNHIPQICLATSIISFAFWYQKHNDDSGTYARSRSRTRAEPDDESGEKEPDNVTRLENAS